MIRKFEKTIEKKYETQGKKFLAKIKVFVDANSALNTSISIFKIDNETTGAQILIAQDSLNDIFQVETFYEKEWIKIDKLHSRIDQIIHEFINGYLIGEKNIEHVTKLLDSMEGQ